MQASLRLGRTRLGRRSVLVVALCSGAARSQSGDAESPSERYRLQWVREGGAESCVSGPALARLLPRVVAPNAAEAGEPLLLLDGVIEPALPPLTFRARITVRMSGTNELVGERELTTAETKCAALTPALLLVLAMSVDPEAAQGGLPEEVRNELRRERDEDVDVWPVAPAGSPTPKPQLAAPQAYVPPLPRATSGARVAPRSRGAPRASLEGAVALSAELQPALAPGAMLGGRLRWSDDWSTSLQAVAWWPQAVAPAPSPYLLDDAIDFQAAQLVLAVCRRALGADTVYLEGCAGATLGVRWLSARALAVKDNPWRLFFGPELGARAGLRLGGGWSLEAGVNATAALRRQRFAYEDFGARQRTLFEPYWLSGRALVGVEKDL